MMVNLLRIDANSVTFPSVVSPVPIVIPSNAYKLYKPCAIYLGIFFNEVHMSKQNMYTDVNDIDHW